MASRSSAWERVRTIEDVMALLASVEDRRRVIRVHAWQEGDWGQVYVEATAMAKELARLKGMLAERWEYLFGVAGGENTDGRTGTDRRPDG